MKSIREVYAQFSRDNSSSEFERACFSGLSEATRTLLQFRGYETYEGKVRELARKGDKLWIFHSDRLSAFDRPIGLVPYKGLILAATSRFWLEQASKIMPTHYISSPHPRVLLTKPCTPFKIEVIVRGYLAGSMMRAYAEGERNFCGETLPEDLVAHGPLTKPIITPTTKAEVYEHDVNISPAEILASNLCTDTEWETITKMSLSLFSLGQEVYARAGWILVDTKYEFGKDANGQICLIDEAHTPDSSRLWVQESYATRLSAGLAPEMLDKENIRRYLLSQNFAGHGDVPKVPTSQLIQLGETYLHVAEKLLNKELDTESVSADIMARDLV
jgi:phosphoribosylaminoimidazole-succinocarboxamide synthase